MEANKILHADIIDIIFEGRNKSYGAYDLRKTYNSRLRVSLAVMFIMGAILFYFITRPLNIETVTPSFIPDIEKGVIDVTIPVEAVVKPPSAPVQPAAPAGSTQTGAPVIVSSAPVDPIPATVGFPGTGTDPGPVLIPSPRTGTPGGDTTSIAPSVAPAPATNQVHTSVQVQAAFPGGTEAWRRYLQRNLNADEPLNNNAPPGTYRVIVRFIVSADGSISEVVAETDHGYGMEKEAVKAIKRGPSWIPAQQNGVTVNAYRRQPVTFVVPE